MNEPRVAGIHRKLVAIMQNDNCSICGEELGEVTYGGVTRKGSVEFVGECCVGMLKEVWCGGISVS
jgi:hypothetical protein